MTIERRPSLKVGLALGGVAASLAACFYLRPVAFVTAWRRWSLWRTGARSRTESVATSQGNFRVHYFVAGRGSPLVLLHGINGSGEYWADLAPRLVAAGFRVYLPDLLGFGRSGSPDVDYSIHLQAEFISGWLRRIGVQGAEVVGVSLGGWIALNVADRSPELVSGLILLNSAGPSLETELDTSLFAPETVEQLGALLGMLMPDPPKIAPFLARDLVRSLRKHGWVVRRTLRSILTRTDVVTSEQLQRLRARTLLIWGEMDRVIPLVHAEWLQERIQGAELQVISGCGHAMLETRFEEAAGRILRFLER